MFTPPRISFSLGAPLQRGALLLAAGLATVSLVPTAGSAQDIYESVNESSTPIVFKTGFVLESGAESESDTGAEAGAKALETVPASLENDGRAEPVTSVWACVPTDLQLSIRVGEDAEALAEQEWAQLETNHGIQDSVHCEGGTTTEAVWVGYAEVVQLQVNSGSTDLLSQTTVFGRSALDRDDPDAVAGRMADNTVSIVDGDLEIITREGWGADESFRNPPNDDPNSDTADHITIHHTAGLNDYTETEAAEVVQGIYESHTVGANGWNDIGYNFLIDRFGRVYEGRVGSLGTDGGQGYILSSPTTTGVHNIGFNTGSVGIAFLGTHSHEEEDLGEDQDGDGGHAGEPVTDAARESLLDLVTVISGVHGIDLNTVVTRECILVNEYCENDQLVTPRLTYHRTFSSTTCPGGHVVEQLFGGDEHSEIDFAAGEGLADVETGLLEPAAEGTLRHEFNQQSVEERTAWAKQALEHYTNGQNVDPSGTAESQRDKLRESQRSVVELQRQEAEIKRQISVAERTLS